MMKITKTANIALLASSLLFAACNGGSSSGGSTGGSTGPVTQAFTSPSASVDAFVDSLNYIDNTAYQSYVEVYEDKTYRYQDEGKDDWFVIYDAKYDEHKAVSLQYVRAIVYYDTVRNTDTLASEFRAIETDDILNGEVNGDVNGDDYEVVDYDSSTDSYWGRNSGYEYEDQADTTDVRHMAAQTEELKFFKKAAQVSFEFNVAMPTAMTLVTLGQKIEGMSKKGELSQEDFSILASDMEKVTGASFADIAKAVTNPEAKQALMNKVADKVGTSAANIEQRLLPEMFGINL